MNRESPIALCAVTNQQGRTRSEALRRRERRRISLRLGVSARDGFLVVLLRWGKHLRDSVVIGGSPDCPGASIVIYGAKEKNMPEKDTVERARHLKEKGRSPSVQAGEFVREEIHHIREGKHGAASAKQAIAIGLSQARRAGVDLPPPAPGKTSERTRKSAQSAYEAGQRGRHGRPSRKRSQATEHALQREGHSAASHQALSRQSRSAAKRRSPADRSEAAERAVQTKGEQGRHEAAVKAARTRAEG